MADERLNDADLPGDAFTVFERAHAKPPMRDTGRVEIGESSSDRVEAARKAMDRKDARPGSTVYVRRGRRV